MVPPFGGASPSASLGRAYGAPKSDRFFGGAARRRKKEEKKRERKKGTKKTVKIFSAADRV